MGFFTASTLSTLPDLLMNTRNLMSLLELVTASSSEQEEGCMMLRKVWKNSKYEPIHLKSVQVNEYWLFLGNTDFKVIEINSQNTSLFYTEMRTVTSYLYSSVIRWQISWVDFTIWWGWGIWFGFCHWEMETCS